MLVAASAGNPMTSPTAKMFGTAVRYWSSTAMRPRESADSPAASRSSASVCPCRPAEYMTASAAMRLPETSRVTVPCVLLSTPATSSPNRNDTDRSRRWNFSDSATSGSHISSIAGRLSMTVTRVPSAANIDAYSIPMIPAPTTTIEFGTFSSASTPSESRTVLPSNCTVFGRCGLLPVAMTTKRALNWVRRMPSSSRTPTVCSSRNEPVPLRMSTWLRSSCARITSCSRPITCCVRANRSSIVMSDFTR